MSVAALFTRARSNYLAIDGVECYDAARDARTFTLDRPVIAHPPCRAWGKFAAMAKPRADERDLAWWALHVVRLCGGVLEHPGSSRLWKECGALTPGLRDSFGGVIVPVLQSWYEHRAPKFTFLYVVGPVPELKPLPDGVPVGRIEFMGRAERESTPPAFARFLVDLARACK